VDPKTTKIELTFDPIVPLNDVSTPIDSPPSFANITTDTLIFHASGATAPVKVILKVDDKDHSFLLDPFSEGPPPKPPRPKPCAASLHPALRWSRPSSPSCSSSSPLAAGGSHNDAIHSLNLLEIKEGHGQDYSYVRSQVFAITDIDTCNKAAPSRPPTAAKRTGAPTSTPPKPPTLRRQPDHQAARRDGVEPEQDTRTYYLLRPRSPPIRTTAPPCCSNSMTTRQVRTAQAWP